MRRCGKANGINNLCCLFPAGHRGSCFTPDYFEPEPVAWRLDMGVTVELDTLGHYKLKGVASKMGHPRYPSLHDAAAAYSLFVALGDSEATELPALAAQHGAKADG